MLGRQPEATRPAREGVVTPSVKRSSTRMRHGLSDLAEAGNPSRAFPLPGPLSRYFAVCNPEFRRDETGAEVSHCDADSLRLQAGERVRA